MLVSSEQITVRVLKHDGVEYRRWNAHLREQVGRLLVLDAEFERDVSHNLLGEIKRGTKTIEYYWLDRWYSIFRFLESHGATRLWYCNINKPPCLEQATLSYVDMDIDVLVKPDLQYEVLDEDEFAINGARYGYSNQEKEQVHAALNQLLNDIRAAQFPFRIDRPETSINQTLC